MKTLQGMKFHFCLLEEWVITRSTGLLKCIVNVEVDYEKIYPVNRYARHF